MIEQKTLSRQELDKILQGLFKDNSIDKRKEIAREIHTAFRHDKNKLIELILKKMKKTGDSINIDNVEYSLFGSKNSGKGGQSLENEETFISKFSNDNNYQKELLKEMGKEGNYIAIKPIKKNGYTIKQTDEWKNLKKGTNEVRISPKTDVILLNVDTNEYICVSLKSGKGRATSADCFETKAILISVVNGNENYSNNKDLVNKVNELCSVSMKEKLKNSDLNFTQMKEEFSQNPEGLGFERLFQWYSKIIDSNVKSNSIWKFIVKKYPNFKKDVIMECLTGKYKFGSNSGCANYLVELKNSKSTEINLVINLEEESDELTKYCSEIGNGNVFAVKSSEKTLWQRFL